MTAFNITKNVADSFDISVPSGYIVSTGNVVRINGASAIQATPSLTKYSTAAINMASTFSATATTVSTGPTEVIVDALEDCSIVQGRTDSFSLYGYDLRLGLERTAGVSIGYYKAWMPFVLNVTQGTPIISANIYLVATATVSNDVSTKVGCENTAQAVTPTSYADLNSRVLTSAFTLDNALVAWNAGSVYSFDITTAVQEIVNLSTWVYGHSLAVLFMRGTVSTLGFRNFASSSNPTYDPPQLIVTY